MVFYFMYKEMHLFMNSRKGKYLTLLFFVFGFFYGEVVETRLKLESLRQECKVRCGCPLIATDHGESLISTNHL